MDRDTLIRRIRSLQPVLAESGVAHVAMYGSRARGDHRENSDLDLLIEVMAGRRFSLLDLIGVEHTIGDGLGLPVSATVRRAWMRASRK